MTLNEACRDDVARIARRTGYDLRFSRVTDRAGASLRPTGRPRAFGDAVLTDAAVRSADSHDFEAQAGIEWRRWLCVTTRDGVDVCTAHLATRTITEAAGNDAQCAELAALLSPCGRPRGHLRGRRQPAPALRPRRRLDPDRRFGRSGSRDSSTSTGSAAPIALSGGGARHAHRPRFLLVRANLTAPR